MSAIVHALPAKRGERLFAELAATAQDIREAQSLRFRVFGEEMGATLKGSEQGIDVDEYDSVCQHLVVREANSGRVVGCTRLLTDTQARRIGRFYSETEFDLGPVLTLPGRLLEIGRTCIAPEYRQGAAIAVLWSGLAGFVYLHGFDSLFGCASVPLGTDDLQAAAIMNRIRRAALAGPDIRVVPRVPLLITQAPDDVLDAPLPSLLKAYIRAGAKACGEPCRDPDFGVADVLMLLNVAALNPAFSRHFIERAAGT
jgi:putative hemolysin